MSCSFDKERLTGYYDGELETAEKADVERHISACSECLRDLGEIKSASFLVKELPRHRAPRSIAEGVSREIAAARKVHSFDRWRKGLLWATATAAGVFVALNVVYFTSHGPSSRPDASMAERSPSPAPVIASKQTHDEEDSAQQKAPQAGAPALDRVANRRAIEETEKAAAGGRLMKKLDESDGKALGQRYEEKKSEPAKPQGAARPEPAKDPALPPAKSAPPAPEAMEKKRPERGQAPAEGKDAPRAAAPPAPATAAAPKPAAPPAAPADKENALKQKESLQEQDRQRAKDAGPTAAPQWTVASADGARARTRVEEALRKLGVKPDASPDVTSGAFRKVGAARPNEATLTVELTVTQLAELRKELEKQPGTRVLAGRPQDHSVSALRADQPGGKGGAGFAGPAAESAPAAKEADAKKAAAEARKGSETLDDAAKREAAGKADAKAELKDKAAGEPRQKVTLHFLELPPDKK